LRALHAGASLLQGPNFMTIAFDNYLLMVSHFFHYGYSI
jgi:hypothetical protein